MRKDREATVLHRLFKILYNFHFPAASTLSSASSSDTWDLTVPKLSSFVSIKHLLKLVFIELLVFLAFYYAINLSYRFGMPPTIRLQFEEVVNFFARELAPIGRDLMFLLGFYVSLVAKRWWQQYNLLPWPDSIAITLSGKQHMLYANVHSYNLIFSSIPIQVLL